MFLKWLVGGLRHLHVDNSMFIHLLPSRGYLLKFMEKSLIYINLGVKHVVEIDIEVL